MRNIICILLSLLYVSVNAQNVGKVRGIVSDQNGVLQGVSVFLKGTTIGTTTNDKGEYSIKFEYKKGEKTVFVFSFIGKETQVVEYRGQGSINIFLKDELQELEAVVVSGKTNINAIKFREKIGNVETVKSEKIKDIPTPNIALSLQGKVAGLQIINRGDLGTLPKIRIRGTSSFRKGDKANEPLYILDGKMISAETFFYLNIEDIKEMKVLKDAVASAIYGIKAANGVIEITSKKGGSKRLTVHSQNGITFPSKMRVKLMNTAEKLQLEELLENENTPGYKYSKKYIEKKYLGTSLYDSKLLEAGRVLDSLKREDTNWHKKLVSMETYSKQDINFRNGSDNNSYFISVGYSSQGGQMRDNKLWRISGQMGIDQNLWKGAVGSVVVSGAYSKTETPNGGDYSIEQLIYDLNPYETENSKEFYSYPRRNFKNIFNQFKRDSNYKSFGSSLSLNWKVFEGMEISSVFGLDYSLNENLEKIPETAFSQTKGGIPINARGFLSQGRGSMTNVTGNIRINYEKTMGNHQFTFGANADNYKSYSEMMSLSGYGVFGNMKTAAAIDNSLEGTYAPKVGGKAVTERNLGFGFLSGYTYKDMYNLFGTYKLDASSVLPKENRWNAAWAIGSSVNMKRYSIFEGKEWLKSLDLRASYGNTANAQGISPSLITSTFEYKGTSYMNVRELEIMALPNEELRAEQNEILDLGISGGIYDTYLSLSYYKRKTKDALLSIPIASSSGFKTQLQNIGVLENRGVEMSLSQTVLSGEGYKIRFGGSLSYNKNIVLDLYGRDKIYTGEEEDAIPDYQVGKSVDGLYGFKSVGINPMTGLPEFINSEGKQVSSYTKMRSEDFVYLGEQTPPYNGSFYLNCFYKRMYFDIDFYFSLGGVKAYSNTYVRDSYSAKKNAISSEIKDTWWNVGDEGKKYPTVFHSSSVDGNLNRPNSRNIGSTDFIRISNISLRYELDKEILNNYFRGINGLSVGLSCANIATFTRYRESDPESGNIVNPMQATVTMNINLTF